MTLLSPLKHFHQTNTRRSAVQIDHANGGTDGVSGAPGFVLPWRAGLGGKRVEKCAEEEHPSCVSMGKRGWERRLGPGERREEEERLGPRPKSLFLGPAPDARSSALHAVGHYATPLPRQTPALSSGSGTRPAAGPARQTPPEQTRTELVPERPAANQKSAASGDREGQARQAEEPATRKLPGEAPPLECF